MHIRGYQIQRLRDGRYQVSAGVKNGIVLERFPSWEEAAVWIYRRTNEEGQWKRYLSASITQMASCR